METASLLGIGFGLLAFLVSGLAAHFLFDFALLQSAAVGALTGVHIGLLAACLRALRALLNAMSLLDD